jgi:hypothetical protein
MDSTENTEEELLFSEEALNDTLDLDFGMEVEELPL